MIVSLAASAMTFGNTTIEPGACVVTSARAAFAAPPTTKTATIANRRLALCVLPITLPLLNEVRTAGAVARPGAPCQGLLRRPLKLETREQYLLQDKLEPRADFVFAFTIGAL